MDSCTFGIGIGDAASGWMPEYEAGLVCRWGCDMRMDGVDDMARASARRYEWRVWSASRTGSGAQQCAEQG